jgi:flagellar biogenesis protein FliO
MDSPLHGTPALLARLRSLWSRVTFRRRQRSLRVCETVSLGDKRLVAVLEFERQRFLIGVTSQSVSLLHVPMPRSLGALGLPATFPATGATGDETCGDQP